MLSGEAILKLLKTADVNLERQEASNIKHILTIMKKVTDSWEEETTESPTESTQQPTSTSGPSTQTSESITQGTAASVTMKFMTLLSLVIVGILMK